MITEEFVDDNLFYYDSTGYDDFLEVIGSSASFGANIRIGNEDVGAFVSTSGDRSKMGLALYAIASTDNGEKIKTTYTVGSLASKVSESIYTTDIHGVQTVVTNSTTYNHVEILATAAVVIFTPVDEIVAATAAGGGLVEGAKVLFTKLAEAIG